MGRGRKKVMGIVKMDGDRVMGYPLRDGRTILPSFQEDAKDERDDAFDSLTHDKSIDNRQEFLRKKYKNEKIEIKQKAVPKTKEMDTKSFFGD
jgi:hypothetical protein